MDASQFDRISRLFAERRLSRREAMIKGASGLAAGAAAVTGIASVALAQEATPVPSGDEAPAGVDGFGSSFLFVQSFREGGVAAKDGAEGTYTLSLQQGLGHTIYFSDRPQRIVGAAPTDKFLAGLGFEEDNPPNAALVVADPNGSTSIAVLELFNPVFDPVSPGVTYDAHVLQQWQQSLEMEFAEDPTDLAELLPEFAGAHLFIDDCPDTELWCVNLDESYGELLPGTFGKCFDWSDWSCWRLCNVKPVYQNLCNQNFPDLCPTATTCELAEAVNSAILDADHFAR